MRVLAHVSVLVAVVTVVSRVASSHRADPIAEGDAYNNAAHEVADRHQGVHPQRRSHSHWDTLASSCSATWEQCGGQDWDGPTCCSSANDVCHFQNNWYSQCTPSSTAPTSSTHAPTQTPPSSTQAPTQAPTQSPTSVPQAPSNETPFPTLAPTTSCADTWRQCGGQGFSGPTCCSKSSDVCNFQSTWYSQCIPASATSSPTTKAPTTSKEPSTNAPTAIPSAAPTKAPTSPTPAPTASIKAFDICATSNSGKSIALTLDDGPFIDGQTAKVLDMLKSQGVKATFFVVGSDDTSVLTQKCTLLKRMKSEGHYIGAHSWNHIDFTKSSLNNSQLYTQQVARVKTWIESCTGQSVTLFRPPFGALTRSQAQFITSQGLTLAFWNYGSNDWKTPNDHNTIWNAFEAWIADYTSHRGSPRSIVIGMHDTAESDPPTGVKPFVQRLVETYSATYNFITAENCVTQCASSDLVSGGICTDGYSPFWGMFLYL